MRISKHNSVFHYVVYVILSTLVLAFVLTVFTSITVTSWFSALVALILILVMQGLLQPIFSLVARGLGVLGILLVSFLGLAFVVWGALELVPGINNVTFGESIIAAWIYAFFVSVLQWVLLAQSDDFFLQSAMRKARRYPSKMYDSPGFVFVQLDGVSAPVFEWQLNAGNLPNIKTLIDKDEYVLTPWHTQLPSTTPASQAGILHGSHEGIPAFRWFERATDKLMVANQPADAAIIEKRLSNGQGLLADKGVSVGNLFSGDAPTNIMVMSKLDGDRGSLRSMSDYTDYFTNINGFMRGFILSIGEMIKEIYQGQRQKSKDIQPRVARKASYVALRAGTNVLLRDLQTTIVIDQMMKGTNSVYVDYLDYDEIAHHAGIARPESLAALSGLDTIIGILTKAAKLSQRPYHVVFVSDHGQSQGPTFKQLNGGSSLEQIVGDIMGTSAIQSSTAPVEQESIARSLFAQQGSSKGVTGSTARQLGKQYKDKTAKAKHVSHQQVELVVTGSGNLGNIWLKSFKKKPDITQIDEKYPNLIKNLLEVKGIGMVILLDVNQQPICKTAKGSINLNTEEVEGINPLRGYSNIRIKELLNLAQNTNAPDIQVISAMNSSTGEVYAFEELVGNHGGIGGGQTEAILIHPTKLKIAKRFYENDKLYDSTTIHKIFVDWLKQAGQRK